MADLKISQLTGATTPLAGTEVVPLVQSSTTKKVAVSDLTAGRAVSMASINVSSSAASSAVAGIYNTDTSNGNGVYVKAGGVNSGKYNAYLQNAAGQDLLIIYADGTLQTGIGNIVQGTAAKGINFTANTAAAGMTSQLLNWYEEGTFTVSFVPSTSGTITMSTNTLTYTRIGRTVTINGLVKVSSVSSPVGYLKIQSLPYAGATGAQNRTAMSIVGSGLAATMTTSLNATVQSDSTIYVFKYDGAGGVANCAQDIQANSEFFIGGTYIV